jgi:hypothetical protein
MANFTTGMDEWKGGFAPVSPIQSQQKSDPWGELAAKLIPGALDAMGKGYAQAKGENILGASTSAEEAQTAVSQFADAVPFSDDPSNTADQKARIEDMKTEALKKYGTNDKKLQALVSAGKISTLEANARRHQLIQESLSNPVLAMFKDEFMDASAAFTGGPGLTEQFFGAYMPTEEERVRMGMIDESIKNTIAFESTVQQTSQLYGISPEAATKLVRHNAEQEAFLKQKESEHKLRTFSSAESYNVAMGHVDKITTEITNGLAAVVANGQKFDDPARVLAQIQQARAVGAAEIARYGDTMTPDDRKSAEGELNKRLDDLSNLVKDADGHKFFMEGIARVKGSVEANEARHTQAMMNALGPLWTIYKHAPELAKTYQGALAEDKAAQFKLQTDPLGKYIIDRLGLNLDPGLLPKVGEKIVKGEKNFSAQEAVLAVATMFTGGADGVKAEVEMVQNQPDVHTALLKTAFEAMPDGDVLSPYANSRDWIVKAQTPDGAKAVANAISARVSQARSLQMRTGDIPSGKIVVRERTPDNKSIGKSAVYEFHTPGIDPAVQKDMIQTIKILRNSPQVLKELGVESAEDYLQKFFLKP